MADDLSTSQERTEPASAKKKEEARRRGSVAKSMELNSALILLFGLLFLSLVGHLLAAQISAFTRELLVQAGNENLNPVRAHHLILRVVVFFAGSALPLLIGFMLVGVVSSFAQVGVLFTLEPLGFKWNRLNPLTGVKKIFGSKRSIVELTKNLFKVILVALVAYLAIEQVAMESLELADRGVEEILGFMASSSLSVGWKAGVAFLVLAVLDYLYQRYEHERELRMTKQEVKEEMKATEGDPVTKGRIRKVQRQIAYKRMMQDVPRADVVITNPTHVAVALQYDSKKMSAPKVVAKGVEYIAQRIKQLAREHGVPIVEDRALARALYQTVDVGDLIPEQLFQAVAQVLAYIYRMKDMRPRLSQN